MAAIVDQQVLTDNMLARIFECAAPARNHRRGQLSAHVRLRLVCRRWRSAFDELAREPWESMQAVLHPRDVGAFLRAPFTAHYVRVCLLLGVVTIAPEDATAIAGHCPGVIGLELKVLFDVAFAVPLVERCCDTLRELSIGNAGITPELCERVGMCHQLTTLELRAVEENVTPSELARMFGGLSCLHTLTISGCSPNASLLLGALVETAPPLRFLAVESPQPATLSAVLCAACARDLERLQLRFQGSTSALVLVLRTAVPRLPQLRQVALEVDVGLPRDEVDEFVQALRPLGFEQDAASKASRTPEYIFFTRNTK
eukprot:TRINITY_DN396_c0_g1_i1.p2 TRINITY_DN396_c0_g1~~TRINITY_DN396_c0_g1_i1.p2  ORF type:complete len:315 (+),score=81.90 TRINITY_DN396_c0_g1_i1:179-1123(+)